MRAMDAPSSPLPVTPDRDDGFMPFDRPSAPLAVLAGGADRFAVIDTETTGVRPTDRVIEVAVVTVGLDGTSLDRWSSLINPRRPVEMVEIHHITDEMVADAPTFDEAADEIAALISGACIVAHNTQFDVSMLDAEFGRVGGELRVPRSIDTMGEHRWSLRRACEASNVTQTGAHRAIFDAEACAGVFLANIDDWVPGGPAWVAERPLFAAA